MEHTGLQQCPEMRGESEKGHTQAGTQGLGSTTDVDSLPGHQGKEGFGPVGSKKGINIVLNDEKAVLLYDFGQFQSAGGGHENTGGIAAGGHEIDPFYLGIFT